MNIILMGFAFMFVFTAFQTSSMIEQTVLDSFKENENPNFNGSGFVSLAIVYIVFAAANWIAPVIVAFLTAKWSMFAGGIVYTLFVALFLHPYTWSLYLGSVLIGIAAAAIWTGQGNFLTVNSDSTTIARNSGIFWAMLQCSLLFGNLFVYFEFGASDSISKTVRYTVFGALTVIAALGVLIMIAFQPERKGVNISESKNKEATDMKNPLSSIKRAFELLMTKRMGLLCLPFFYSGLELGFFSGVYGTCIGRTQSFGDIAKQLVGINGMFIGVGEILGGGIFGLMGKTTNRFGRDPVILLGYVVHMISFFLVFLNIPGKSALESTSQPAYIDSNEYLAIFCSFLMGFADSCFNTQLYSIVGALYPNDSTPAFALFKFMQSLAAAIAFFYSLGLELQWQLLILVIFGTAGTITFCLAEWDVYVENKQKLKNEIATGHLEQ